jgi:hypothetical protein
LVSYNEGCLLGLKKERDQNDKIERKKGSLPLKVLESSSLLLEFLETMSN